MAKYYNGDVCLRFHGVNIECDGTIEDFVDKMFPDGWDGELLDVKGNISLSYEDAEE